jgi:hypothetical protein
MSNYIGYTPDQIFAAVKNRFFYGLRRTDQGELFLGKADQLKGDDSITVNNPGRSVDDFPNFAEGQDFFEGRNVNHELVYQNLNYEQFKWDDRNLFYYVNNDGELVIRTNKEFNYPDGTSSEGIFTETQTTPQGT